jgi:hypothetical protein
MKTLIACTDLTASSINACKYAAFLAQKLNCKLTIFNLFEAPLIHSNAGLYGISYSTLRSASELKTNKLIKNLQIVFPKVKIDHFVSFGNFKNELERFLEVHQVEAAVMGLEAKEKISKFIYGTRGVKLAGKINCPVIIVPSTYKIHKLSQIVLAVDTNEKLTKTHLKGFEKFVKKSKAKLKLLHVRTPNEVLDPVTNSLKLNGKRSSIDVVGSHNISDGIKKYSSLKRSDLISIISKEHSVFYNFFSESNTKRIAFAAKVPVMAIHK